MFSADPSSFFSSFLLSKILVLVTVRIDSPRVKHGRVLCGTDACAATVETARRFYPSGAPSRNSGG
jgi:hypothetical protein